ncbi:hypothetical protein M5689_019280 [Euphorbia peplus]|nr:hypothetical protein M5689_019280 [Euphorbia peplus]
MHVDRKITVLMCVSLALVFSSITFNFKLIDRANVESYIGHYIFFSAQAYVIYSNEGLNRALKILETSFNLMRISSLMISLASN